MSAATPPWPPEHEARRAVLVLMVAYIFSYIDRQILAMLVGPIKADLGVTDFELSLLNGLAFAVCFTVLGVWPVGQWADRGNRRNLAAAGVFLWSLMTAVCGRVTSYAGLFVARVGVGVGEATLAPAAYSMIADYVPPARRGRALGLFSMGIYLGIGVAIMVTGLVVQAVGSMPVMHWAVIGEVRGWQVAFLILGPPGMLVSLWLLTVREPARREAAASTTGVRYADVWRRIREHAGFYVIENGGRVSAGGFIFLAAQQQYRTGRNAGLHLGMQGLARFRSDHRRQCRAGIIGVANLQCKRCRSAGAVTDRLAMAANGNDSGRCQVRLLQRLVHASRMESSNFMI